MKTLELNATLSVTVTDLNITVSDNATEDEILSKVKEKLNNQLTLLDIKGSRSGDDGFVTEINVDSMDW